ncbi:alpha/beta hydrolase [Escherichia coli]
MTSCKLTRPGTYCDERCWTYHDDLYDTVIGYRGGNWIYEWATQAMVWQQKACAEEDSATQWLTRRHARQNIAAGFI